MVARFVRDEEVAGSNPVTPTIKGPCQRKILGVGDHCDAALPDYLPDYAEPELGAKRLSMTVAPVWITGLS